MQKISWSCGGSSCQLPSMTENIVTNFFANQYSYYINICNSNIKPHIRITFVHEFDISHAFIGHTIKGLPVIYVMVLKNDSKQKIQFCCLFTFLMITFAVV